MAKKSRRVKPPRIPYVRRPFAGLQAECDLVALREFVPSATAPVTLRDDDRPVLLCTLLPGAAPASVRDDGTIWLGLQVRHAFRDPSRDLAAALELALDAEPGDDVSVVADPGEGPSLQDLLVDSPLEVTVSDGFAFWGSDNEELEGLASPTRRLDSVPVTGGAAYWVDEHGRRFLRWVMPQEEDALLDALARLHAANRDGLGDGTRLIGMFRALGVLVPVWELAADTEADALEAPAAAFAGLVAETLADAAPLDGEERAARAGLTNRQLTLR